MSAVATATAQLAASGVSVRRGTRPVLVDVSVAVGAGELVAVVGPNGSGKSTLLGALAGDLARSSTVHVDGDVTVGGDPLRALSGAELARRRAVLTQENRVAFAFTAEQVVELARAPWRGSATEADDRAAVDAALDRADAQHLRHRPVTELSGGERARVALARALAQTTPVLLLDEPTAALDLAHQEQVLEAVRDLADAGHAVLVVLHDLDAAAAYADRLVVLHEGRVVADAPPTEALTPQLIERVYGWPVDVVPDATGARVSVRPRRRPRA